MSDYYTIAKVITPSDTLPNAFDAIYVGGAGGTVTVMPDQGGVAVLFSGVPIGAILPIKTRLVLASGTAATLLVGMR